MIFVWFFIFIYGVSSEFGTNSIHLATVHEVSEEKRLEELPAFRDLNNVGFFNDAEHRGNKWYDDDSSKSGTDDEMSKSSQTSAAESSSITESKSSDASSFETSEKKILTRKYRSCTPCPQDKLKKHSNRGIKWICGSYQRARRTFKSLCMMRYRNCQDGTKRKAPRTKCSEDERTQRNLFVKIYDHRCKNDTFHGRHWFYVYRT